MSEASSSPKRPRLDFDETSKDDQFEKFKVRDQDDSQPPAKSRKRADLDEDEVKDDDVKSKPVNREATPREHTLVLRLTNKEQELQECMSQIQEMKQAQTQKTAHLRSMLLDPAINLVFQRMAKEMEEHKEKLKQKQNELSAWKFTPDSQTGMRLMAKCRMLLQENGDLGKMISSGRTARLEGEISLHKALVTEMKKNQKELDEFVGELEEDVEGMQGMIFMLQEQLKEAREQIARLQQENEQLRTLRMPPDPEPGGEGSNPAWANGDAHSTTCSSRPPVPERWEDQTSTPVEDNGQASPCGLEPQPPVTSSDCSQGARTTSCAPCDVEASSPDSSSRSSSVKPPPAVETCDDSTADPPVNGKECDVDEAGDHQKPEVSPQEEPEESVEERTNPSSEPSTVSSKEFCNVTCDTQRTKPPLTEDDHSLTLGGGKLENPKVTTDSAEQVKENLVNGTSGL